MSVVIGEMKVVYTTKQDVVKRPKITGSEDAVRICRDLYDPTTIEHHEEFWAVYLNRSNGVIGWARIRECAKVFDIQVLDHVIIAPGGGWYSYADMGRM